MAETTSSPRTPAAGFYTVAHGRFFVSSIGMVFELLDDLELDGPDEALVTMLPSDAEPLGDYVVLPSFVVRMAVRLGLDLPAPLQVAGAADLLDEIHWRQEADGSMPLAGVGDLVVLTTLVDAEFVVVSELRVRIGTRAVQALEGLSRALCGRLFSSAAATDIA